MGNFKYHKELEALWHKAVDAFKNGNEDAASWFTEDDKQFIDSIGLSVHEMFDFAEDYVSSEYPDLGAFLMIQDIRKTYFTEIQGSKKSENVIKPGELPARDSEANGFVWLPRIRTKALGKLKGELDPDIMYSCGGDRKFLSEHDIHPAEFLRMAWKFGDDEQGLYDWVSKKSKAITA